jgi:hypothetical protein
MVIAHCVVLRMRYRDGCFGCRGGASSNIGTPAM